MLLLQNARHRSCLHQHICFSAAALAVSDVVIKSTRADIAGRRVVVATLGQQLARDLERSFRQQAPGGRIRCSAAARGASSLV